MAVLLATLAAAGAAAPAARAGEVPADGTVVEVVGNDLRAALFLAIDLQRLTDPRTACEALVLEAALLERYRGAVAPSQTPQQVVVELQALRSAYRGARGIDACARRFLNEGVMDLLAFAEGSDVLGPAGKQALRAVARTATSLSGASGNGVGERGLTALGDLSDLLGDQALAPWRLIRDAIAEAARDPQYADARDRLLVAETGRSILAPLSSLIEHPALEGNPVVGLITGGVLQTDFGQLMQIATRAREQLDAARDAAAAALSSVRDRGLTPSAAAEAATVRDALILEQRRRLVLVAFALRTATTVVGQALKAAGERLETLAGLVTNVTVAVNDLARRVSRRAGEMLAPFAQAARQLLNRMGIFALGNVAQETRDQRVLDAIAAVRQDVAELREEMNERFDRVDAKLDAIYGEMVTRFDELSAKLSSLDSGMRSVRDDLAKLAAQVERLERNVYQLFRDSQDRELWTQINTAIGYRERSVGGEAMSNAQFLGFEGFFFSWATNSAYDSIATGPPSRPVGEDAVEQGLAVVPLEGNLGYLSNVTQGLFGLPPLSSNPLPNLRDLAVASQAYAALLQENPEYVTDGIRARLDTVLERNRQVSRALALLSARDAPGIGTGSRAFNAAIAFYRRAGLDPEVSGKHSVASALAALETAFVGSLKTPKNNTLALDLFGTVDQVGPVDSDVPFVSPNCSQGPFGATLQTPATVARDSMVLPRLRNALRLAGGEAEVVCSVSASDRRRVPAENGQYDNLADFTVQWRTQRRATVGQGAWQTHVTRTHTFQDVAYCRQFGDFESGTCPSDQFDPWQEVEERWPGTFSQTGWKSIFEAQAVAATDPTVHGALGDVARDGLLQRQRQLYQHIVSKVADEPLRGALSRLTGARGLLGAFAEFGLWRGMDEDPQLRGALTGDQRLPAEGAEQLISAPYVAAATGALPPVNVRETVRAQIAERVGMLEQALLRVVDESAAPPADAAGERTGVQTNPLIEVTSQRLTLARAVTMPPPAGGGSTTDPDSVDPPAGGTPPPAGGTGGTTTPPPPAPPTTGGSGTPAGAGAGPGGGPVQRPSLLTGLRVAATRIGALRRGLPVTVRAQRPGRLAARLTVDAKTARALGLGTKTVLGSAATAVRKAGPAKVVVKVGTGVLGKLRRSRAPVPATLRATLTTADGTVSREAAAKVVLRR